jgi:hypothetical protein
MKTILTYIKAMILLFSLYFSSAGLLFPGLALLQKERGIPIPESELLDAPPDLIQEATIFHPYAEAAYTVPR